MVESSLCPACSSPVLAGQAYCPTCGAPQARDAAPDAATPDAGTPDAAKPSGEPTMPDWALRPSSASSMARPDGPSMSVSIGAIPISSVGGKAATANAAAAPSAAAGPGLSPPPFGTPPGTPSPFAAPAPPRSPFAAPISRPVPPVAVPQSPAKPAQKESTQELVAFGLTAAGVVMGAASQFLPWTGVVGMGIGTTSPSPNQWGWALPAAVPLFLLSILVLAGVTGSDRAKEKLPNLASVIVQVTDLIMPMILGGLYLGVVLLYVTLPSGFGSGLLLGQLVLLVGAGLLIAGAVLALLLPPKDASHPD